MKQVGLICLLLLVGGCVRPEDFYEGRPGSYWLQELKHPDAGARWRAAVALGQIGPSVAKRAIPLLNEALKDEDPLVRWAAAGALGKFGPAAKVAVPNLSEMMVKDEDPTGRDAAREALRLIDAGQYYQTKSP